MIFISTDAFNNPDSPLYYIVGAIFLLLICGALAAYLLVSKHLQNKKGGDAAGVEAKDGSDLEETDSAAPEESNELSRQSDTVTVETEETEQTKTE